MTLFWLLFYFPLFVKIRENLFKIFCLRYIFFHFGLKLTGCQKTHCVCIVSPRLFTFFSKVKNTISITDRVKTHGIRHVIHWKPLEGWWRSLTRSLFQDFRMLYMMKHYFKAFQQTKVPVIDENPLILQYTC